MECLMVASVTMYKDFVFMSYKILIFQKQLNSLNKTTSNLLDIINSAKEEWENDSSMCSYVVTV